MGSANPGKTPPEITERPDEHSASSAPAPLVSHPDLEQQISCTDPALGKSFGLVLDSNMFKKKKIKISQPNQMVLAKVTNHVPHPGSTGPFPWGV